MATATAVAVPLSTLVPGNVAANYTSVTWSAFTDPTTHDVTLGATVAPIDGAVGGTPTGFVTFYDGNTCLGAATLSGGFNPTGQITFTLTSPSDSGGRTIELP